MYRTNRHARPNCLLSRAHGARRLIRAIGAVALLMSGGCAPGLAQWATDRLSRNSWVGDYDTAEQRVRETDRELLILYLNDRPQTGPASQSAMAAGVDHAIERILRSDRFEQPPTGTAASLAAPLSSTYVCCTLVRSYEPDRRYVAQYGVDRAPALIVVHRDGTYHSITGTLSAARISDFLATAAAPGTTPGINPYIPRKPRYNWLASIDEAEAVSRRTGRSMLVVFHRSYSRDWRKLNKQLRTPEVYLRLGGLVHARVGLFRPSVQAYLTRFGAVQLPALVVAHPDGDYAVLELPTSSEAIVHFADAARQKSKSQNVKKSKPGNSESPAS